MAAALAEETLERRLHVRPARDGHAGHHVLYWMTTARRSKDNLALQHAIHHASRLNVPLVVVEPLAIGHRWASDRLHTFVLQGMIDQRTAFEGSGITYIPYVETRHGDARGLLARMSHDATLLVIDDYPTYMPKQVTRRALDLAPCAVHVVDGNGFIAMRHADRDFTTAHSLRRHLHKTIEDHLADLPLPEPLIGALGLPDVDQALIDAAFSDTGTLPTPFEFIWRTSEGGAVGKQALSALDIDHEVTPVARMRGGSRAAEERWRSFLNGPLASYHQDRNHPDLDGATGLSPWLHFGHISAQRMVRDVLDANAWDPGRVSGPHDGRRAGWWGLGEGAEAFLDQIITWRDLSFLHCYRTADHDRYTSLPQWAKTTLDEHRNDARPADYTFEQLEAAATDDELWNSAQRQLLRDGVIQNYLRMLWGKKILEWAPTPELAFEWMISLNDRWAVDGRDPNSYGGIGWVCGKFDRGWTERAVYGKVRCMMSPNTRRKVKAEAYVQRYGAGVGLSSGSARFRMPPRQGV